MLDCRPICLSCSRFALVDFWSRPLAHGYCEACFNFFVSLTEPYEVRKFVELELAPMEGGAVDVEIAIEVAYA